MNERREALSQGQMFSPVSTKLLGEVRDFVRTHWDLYCSEVACLCRGVRIPPMPAIEEGGPLRAAMNISARRTQAGIDPRSRHRLHRARNAVICQITPLERVEEIYLNCNR